MAYTDGLFERRGQDLDRGIAMVANAVGADRREPDELCAVLAELARPGDSPGNHDDVAIVVVELDGDPM